MKDTCEVRGDYLLNLENFMVEIDERIVRRGLAYFMDDHISALEDLTAYTCVAKVEGTDTYNVQVEWNVKKDILASSCSCPYDWGPYCKHEVAIFIFIKEFLLQRNSTRPTKRNIDLIIEHREQETQEERTYLLLIMEGILEHYTFEKSVAFIEILFKRYYMDKKVHVEVSDLIIELLLRILREYTKARDEYTDCQKLQAFLYVHETYYLLQDKTPKSAKLTAIHQSKTQLEYFLLRVATGRMQADVFVQKLLISCQNLMSIEAAFDWIMHLLMCCIDIARQEELYHAIQNFLKEIEQYYIEEIQSVTLLQSIHLLQELQTALFYDTQKNKIVMRSHEVNEQLDQKSKCR